MYRIPPETMLRRVSYHGRLGDQRTMPKSSREWAEIDVQKERFVCDRWPLCSHRDAEHCGRATPRGLPRWRADEG